MTPLFRFENVGLTSDLGSSILSSISLELKPGEMVGLVGPSGSGKTSLLQLFNRLRDISSGQLLFRGQPISQTPVLELRQQVVLVPQEPHLLEMSVKETLTYALRLRQLPEADIERRLQEWSQRLELPQEWQQRSSPELSVGQRQRLTVARGLMLQPAVLLLDEPTSALDIGQAERLCRQLQQVVTEQQSAVVMANHQLEWVERFCQRVIYLLQGKLRGDWPAAQVDWGQLRQDIATAQERDQGEWGDEG